jgi:Protein of unknown function (DUF3570)
VWVQLKMSSVQKCARAPSALRAAKATSVLALLVATMGSGFDLDVDGQVGGRADAYVDEWMNIISASADAEASVFDIATVTTHYSVDALSGATPAFVADGMTSATNMTETRHEVSAGVRFAYPELGNVGANYGLSIEPDYITHTIATTASADLFGAMTRISAGYRLNVELAGSIHDKTFSQLDLGNSIELTWNQIITKSTTLTALATATYYHCQVTLGCHASPYRYVGAWDDDTAEGSILFALTEKHPPSRARVAAAVRLSQSLGHGIAVRGGYRLYGDSWWLIGQTADVALSKSLFGDRLLVRGEARATLQGPAAFYRDHYATDIETGTEPVYRTGDRELSALHNLTLGMRTHWSLGSVGPVDNITVLGRLSYTLFRYPIFSELPERHAWLLGAGINARF